MDWIEKYWPHRILYQKNKKIVVFMVDETLIKVDSAELIWLWWIAIEPKKNEILAVTILEERNICWSQREFCQAWSKIIENIRYPLMVGHGIRNQGNEYLKLDHHIFILHLGEIFFGRTIQYIKERQIRKLWLLLSL